MYEIRKNYDDPAESKWCILDKEDNERFPITPHNLLPDELDGAKVVANKDIDEELLVSGLDLADITNITFGVEEDRLTINGKVIEERRATYVDNELWVEKSDDEWIKLIE